MENKKETPAQIAERALRNFNNGTPIPVLLDAVEKALSESVANVKLNEVWVPCRFERYCTVHASVSTERIFSPINLCWLEDRMDYRRMELGWVFRTLDEAQALCDKLNEAIKEVAFPKEKPTHAKVMSEEEIKLVVEDMKKRLRVPAMTYKDLIDIVNIYNSTAGDEFKIFDTPPKTSISEEEMKIAKNYGLDPLKKMREERNNPIT